MLLATALTVAGCIGVSKTYDNPGQTVPTGVNQQFVIALGSNPTTGYGWQESYDRSMLELVEKTYKSEAEEDIVGAGGVEYFRFQALKAGQTEVTLVYQRPWEEANPENLTRVFTVNVK